MIFMQDEKTDNQVRASHLTLYRQKITTCPIHISAKLSPLSNSIRKTAAGIIRIPSPLLN